MIRFAKVKVYWEGICLILGRQPLETRSRTEVRPFLSLVFMETRTPDKTRKREQKITGVRETELAQTNSVRKALREQYVKHGVAVGHPVFKGAFKEFLAGLEAPPLGKLEEKAAAYALMADKMNR